tara:strand:+ start:187 stop:402 length:216 start_codon:yes stop_codon:yes gene_type:complete
MEIVAGLLLIMVILTLINGIVFFKTLIKLQKENNDLIKKLLNKEKSDNKPAAMPSADLEKLKYEYMHKRKF